MSYTPPPPGPEGPPGNPYEGGGYDGTGNGGPGYGGPGYGGPGYGGPADGPAGNNNKAVFALVLGILGLPLSICCSILGLVGVPAIILGRVARREIAASGGRQTGDGMAKWGFILGIADVVIGLVLFVIGIVLVATGHGSFGFTSYSG